MVQTSRKRITLGIILIVTSVVIAAIGLAVVRSVGSSRPKGNTPDLPTSAKSFLLITVDTTRADHLESYGADFVETPSLEAFAQHGIVFEQGYAVAPVTLVSHTSMLSGLYPPNHGVRNNGIHYVADDVTTIAEMLDKHGFTTAAFVSASVLEDRYGLDQGFEHYDDDVSEGGNRSGRLVPDRPADQTVDAVIAWLNGVDKDTRFFAWVHFYDPHAAYAPPPPYRDRYRENPYAGEIAFMDAEIGRLLAHPRLADEHRIGTIIIGDHGESLGEHREETHAILAYDSTLHVPFLMQLPSGPEGQRVKIPVDGADVTPTILRALDLAVPDGLDGQPIHDVLADPQSAMERPLYAETYLPYYTYGWSKLKVLRRGRYKFIDGPGSELYDTQRDPRELTNLAERLTDESVDLESSLRKLESEWGDAEREAALAIDSDAAEQLRALGYLAVGSDPVEVDGERPNPRDMVDLHVGLERARRFAASRFFEQAIEALQGVLDRDPGNLAALVDLASAYRALERPDEARVVVERAMAKDPDYPRLYTLMAGIELDQHNREQAVQLLNRALELDPRNIEAAQSKAQILHRMGRREETQQTLEMALELSPGNPNLDITFAQLVEIPGGQVDEAVARVSAALDENPYLPRGWRILGRIAEERRELDHARELYRQGLQRDPDAGELHGALGLLLARTGASEQAAPHLQEAIRLSQEFRPEYHVSLGAIAAEYGRLQEATRHYDLVLEHAPDNLPARNNRAVALYRLGRPDDAIRELDSILADHPQFADAANNRAAIAVDLGEWTVAETWARRTLEVDPSTFEAWNNLGVAQDEMGRHADARASFERALELAPDYRPAQVNLGFALRNLRQWDAAVEAFLAAAASGPADPMVQLELGDLYSGPLDNPERASRHYNAFLNAAPGHPRASEIRRRLATLGP